MRKTIVLIFGLILLVITNAQETKFGVFIDPQVCWLKPESKVVEMSGKIFGIKGGLSIDRYFEKNYAFSTALSLSNQGGKLTYDNQLVLTVYDKPDTIPAGATIDYRLQYLTIPVGLKLKSNEIGFHTFFVQLGFDNQFTIKARATSTNNGGLDDDSIREEIGVYNLAYYFGGGLEYAIAEDTSISFGLFYHSGVLDISKAKPVVNTRQVSLRLGINF